MVFTIGNHHNEPSLIIAITIVHTVDSWLVQLIRALLGV